MGVSVYSLASYVPAYLARCAAASPQQVVPPGAHPFSGAVLLADISGFTALSERLAERGPVGAELLSGIVNEYFGRLIDIVERRGGDVADFTGDGLLAVWEAGEEPEGLQRAAQAAALCGLEVQQELHDYAAAEDIRLSMRVAIGAGQLTALFLGGVDDHCEHFITGSAVRAAAGSDLHARPGDVVLDPESRRLAGPAGIGEPLPDGGLRLVRLLSFGPSSPAASTGVQPEPVAAPVTVESDLLHRYLPQPVLARQNTGHAEWLGELRGITVLFLRLPDHDQQTVLSETQRLFQIVQKELFAYEAVINNVACEAKGTTILAAFGLPPSSHEDDPTRAVRAALALQARLGEAGWRADIGITTGRVFCGAVGNERRRAYTIISPHVNLAARLMQSSAGNILCDESTSRMCAGKVSFEALPELLVRGLREPVRVYRPRQRREHQQPGNVRSGIIGRSEERGLLVGRLHALRRGEAGVVILEGDAGIGKSRLAEFFREQANAMEVTGLVGYGDSVERQRPYHAWRGVFHRLLGLDAIPEPEKRRERALAELQREPELSASADLLNDVLALGIPENEASSALSGQARAERLLGMLCRLLQRAAERAPTAVVLEDAHWLDSASWTLLGRALQEVRPLLLVVALRPLDQPPPEYGQLQEAAQASHLRLEPMDSSDVLSLAAQRLGVGSLPAPVAELIRTRAEGNPFFAEELVCSLRDQNLLRIEEGECILQCAPDEVSAHRFPQNVQGVITSRIDRLTPSQQLTLKVASVIGRTFRFSTLYDAYPVDADKPQLIDYLAVLESLDITPLDSPLPDLRYAFKHSITQEVAYDLMLFSQRKQLHSRVAEWYERTYAEAPAPYYPLLALHWRRAENPEKAVFYLQRAGEQAARSYANPEAESFFRQALQLLPSLPDGPGRGEQELALQLGLGPVLLVTQGQASREAKAAYDRALSLCRGRESTPQLAGTLFGLWAYFLFHGELDTARQVSLQCLSLSDSIGDADLRLQAHFAAGNTLYWLGQLEESTEHVREVLRLHDPSRHQEYIARYAQNPRITVMTFGCMARWALGSPDTALREAYETLALAEEMSHPYSVALALQIVALLHQFRDEVEACREQAERLTDVSAEHGFPPYLVLGNLLHAWAQARAGDPEGAIPRLHEGIATWKAMGVELVQSYYATLLTDACSAAGRREEALSVIQTALESAQASHELAFESELHRWRGCLLAAGSPLPDDAAAEESLRLAIATSAGQRARTLEWKAVASFATFLAERGRKLEAIRSLQEFRASLAEVSGKELGAAVSAMLRDLSDTT